MSDHWNSLANLLGTPSLAPQKPKSEAAVPSKSVPSLREPEYVGPSEEVDQGMASVEEAPRPGKSRLKSSWDAVANFFGVAPEPKSEAPAVADNPVTTKSTSDASKSAPSKKSRPSMWQDRPETPPLASEREETVDSEIVAKRSVNRRESRSDSVGRSESMEARDSTEVPERRSNRRPPRRGSRETSGTEVEKEVIGDRDRDRVPERKKNSRIKPEDKEEDSRIDERRERHDRQRSSSSQRATPMSPPTARRSSGFGSGIEGIDTTNESAEMDSEQSEAPKTRRRGNRGKKSESKDEATQTRRDHERSDRDSRGDRDSRNDIDTLDDAAPEIRHSKIPSWTETIGVLVTANMENHERSQGGRRGNPRGKGRR